MTSNTKETIDDVENISQLLRPLIQHQRAVVAQMKPIQWDVLLTKVHTPTRMFRIHQRMQALRTVYRILATRARPAWVVVSIATLIIGAALLIRWSALPIFPLSPINQYIFNIEALEENYNVISSVDIAFF